MSRKSSRGPRWQRLKRRLLDQRGWRCEKCKLPGPLELHHVVAVEAGGTDEESNLVIRCPSCHLDEHVDPARLAWRRWIAR